MICPIDLKRLYRERRVIPFVGAGASMSVTWEGGKRRGPSWGEMVNEAARLLGADPDLLRVRGTDLQVLEYFAIKKGGLGPVDIQTKSRSQTITAARLTIERKLRAVFS